MLKPQEIDVGDEEETLKLADIIKKDGKIWADKIHDAHSGSEKNVGGNSLDSSELIIDNEVNKISNEYVSGMLEKIGSEQNYKENESSSFFAQNEVAVTP